VDNLIEHLGINSTNYFMYSWARLWYTLGASATHLHLD